jgi:hypothetical protein
VARRPSVFVRPLSMDEGRKIQKISRSSKDPVRLRRAIVVMMSGQGQTVRDITSLLQVSEDSPPNAANAPASAANANTAGADRKQPEPANLSGHRTREATASALRSQLLLATRSRDDRPARSCPGGPGGVANLLGRIHGLVHDPVEVRQLDTE